MFALSHIFAKIHNIGCSRGKKASRSRSHSRSRSSDRDRLTYSDYSPLRLLPVTLANATTALSFHRTLASFTLEICLILYRVQRPGEESESQPQP